MDLADVRAIAKTDAPSISRIFVEGLFGRFTYNLEPAPSGNGLARLLVVYGDNGSGKTTILRLLFHLLSTGDRRGHRTHLAQTPFRVFEVQFSDGLAVRAEREGKGDLGSYTLSYRRGSEDLAQTHVAVDSRGRVTPADSDDDPLARFTSALTEELGFEIVYIGDDRELESDMLPRERDEPGIITTVDPDSGRTVVHHVEARDPALDLFVTIERAQAWIRERALGASNVGSENTNAVYNNVVRTIAAPSVLAPDEGPAFESVRTRLLALANRNVEYQRFGLVPGLPSEELLESIDASPVTQRALIATVLAPFLEGLEARLDALQSIQEALASFARNVNSFFDDKRLNVAPKQGISITTKEGSMLPVGALSSGERQLLLLLTSLLVARDRRAIFIIDEPELSLNMKWQRKLVDALLDITGDSGTLFVLATHSFELMASARPRVIHLSQGIAQRFLPE